MPSFDITLAAGENLSGQTHGDGVIDVYFQKGSTPNATFVHNYNSGANEGMIFLLRSAGSIDVSDNSTSTQVLALTDAQVPASGVMRFEIAGTSLTISMDSGAGFVQQATYTMPAGIASNTTTATVNNGSGPAFTRIDYDEPAANQPPTAGAIIATTNAAGNVDFDLTNSTDSDGTIDQYELDFGDGTAPYVGASPFTDHDYTTNDTFTLTLTVTDDDGATDTTTGSVTVSNAPELPPAPVAAGFSYGVERHIEGGTGGWDWEEGVGVFNTGNVGVGFIDQYALHSLLDIDPQARTTAGPTIAFMERTGVAYDQIEHRAAVGKLDGLYDFGNGDDVYGLVAGDENGAWLAVDPTNGVRFMDGATERGRLQGGTLRLGAADEAHVALSVAGLDFQDGAGNSTALFAAETRLGLLSGAHLLLDGSEVRFMVGAQEKASLSATGLTAEEFVLVADRIRIDSAGRVVIYDDAADERVVLEDGPVPTFAAYGTGSSALIPNGDFATWNPLTEWTYSSEDTAQGVPSTQDTYSRLFISGQPQDAIVFIKDAEQNPVEDTWGRLTQSTVISGYQNKALTVRFVLSGLGDGAGGIEQLPEFVELYVGIQNEASQTVVLTPADFPTDGSTFEVDFPMVPRTATPNVTIQIDVKDYSANVKTEVVCHAVQIVDYKPRSVLTSEGALLFADPANYLRFTENGTDATFSRLRVYDEATGRRGKIEWSSGGGWEIVDV